MSDDLKCQEKRYGHAYFGEQRMCGKKAKPTKDGPRCGVHSPEAKAKRQAKSVKRHAEWKRDWNERDAIEKAGRAVLKAALSLGGEVRVLDNATRYRLLVTRINAARVKRGVAVIEPYMR